MGGGSRMHVAKKGIHEVADLRETRHLVGRVTGARSSRL